MSLDPLIWDILIAVYSLPAEYFTIDLSLPLVIDILYFLFLSSSHPDDLLKDNNIVIESTKHIDHSWILLIDQILISYLQFKFISLTSL